MTLSPRTASASIAATRTRGLLKIITGPIASNIIAIGLTTGIAAGGDLDTTARLDCFTGTAAIATTCITILSGPAFVRDATFSPGGMALSSASIAMIIVIDGDLFIMIDTDSILTVSTCDAPGFTGDTVSLIPFVPTVATPMVGFEGDLVSGTQKHFA